jgi:hypothetical protein
MASGEKPVILKAAESFEEVLDEACGKLRDRQVRNSVIHIREMEDRLLAMEEELEIFLLKKDTNRAG